jgi:paraquat-inducible protein A
MADVFVVAVIAATIKLGMFASVTIHSGLVVFSLAVLSSMLLIHKQMADYELKPKDENT